MSKRKGIQKRYLITVSSIILAVFSVLMLRFYDINFDMQKISIEKEIKAVMEFNKNIFEKWQEKGSEANAKELRDNFANKISYKKLLDEQSDFKNFKYLPDKKIYGFKMLNNAHIGFYNNNPDCGNINEGKDFCAGILVDINGYTKPNRLGKDQFLLKIYKNGIFE